MSDAAPILSLSSRHALGVPLAATAAWLSPWLLDQLSHAFFGATPFDVPWLALHLANLTATMCLMAAVVIAIAAQRTGRALPPSAVWTVTILSALVFGLAPVVKVATGLSSDVLVAGLLPARDAQDYLNGALNLLWTGQLSEWATRRPLVAAQLAGIYRMTGEDLRLSLLLLTGGCAAAALLVAGALRRSYGLAAASAAMASLFAFIYQTLGTTMSESFGFTVGGTAFVLLWHGARHERPWPILAGVALLSLALVARAGAFFVLPMLVLWIGWRFAGQRRFHGPWAAAALAATAVGFIATSLLMSAIGAPGQMAFSNFASTLYGLAHGGEPWTRVFADFPELAVMAEGEQAAAIYRLALAHAVQAPWDPLLGLLTRYNDFLFNMGWHKYLPHTALRGIITALAVVGVFLAIRRRHEAIPSLLLAVLAGVLLSVPFLGDGGSRVFAATHPFTAALAAFGAWGVQQRAMRTALTARERAAWQMPAFAGLLALATLAPLLVALTASLNRAPAGGVGEIPACDPNERAIAAIAPRHGAVFICPLGSATCADGVRAESIAATNIWKTPHVAALTQSALPLQITVAVAEGKKESYWLLARGDRDLPSDRFPLCVRDEDDWLEQTTTSATR